MEFKHIDHQRLRDTLGNFCLGKAGIAEATTLTGGIQIANAIDFVIDGVMYSKAATDDIAMTAAAQQADLSECMYLVSIDSAGVITTTKGTEKLTSLNESVYLPDTPSGNITIGAIKIVTAGATFTAGTTDLSAANITATFYDLIGNVVTGF